MAALGKVSEGPHSSTNCQLLDLDVAGLQGFAREVGGMAVHQTSTPVYMAVVLHFELLATPVNMNKIHMYSLFWDVLY